MLQDDDDWEQAKLGRFNDADERLVRGVMGPWFLRTRRTQSSTKFKGPSTRTQAQDRRVGVQLSRVNTVALGISYSTRKQAVVTVGFCPKSMRDVSSQVLYIARLRPEDKQLEHYKALPLWDGFGKTIDEEEAKSIGERWGLASDQENLSKASRTLLRQGDLKAFQALGERDKLWNTQTWHFVLSVVDGDKMLFERFRAALRATVDAAFTAKGHQSLWTIHSGHTDHIHSHVIVKALSEFGGRIHSDIRGDYLHHLREIFAGNLRRVGLDYEATRRVDRKPLRDQIMAGQAPLSGANMPWTGRGGAYANLKHWSQVYGLAAVENLKRIDAVRCHVMGETRHLNSSEKTSCAANLLRDQLDQDPNKSRRWGFSFIRKKDKTENENLTKAEYELLKYLEKKYHNPRQAMESWRLMASDGAFRSKEGKVAYPQRALAVWTLHHRPELFGLVNSKAFQNDPMRGLKKTLSQIRLWAPERLPGRGQNDNAFLKFRRNSRVIRNRQAVLVELRALHTRVENSWPGTWWSRSLALAIRQAKRVRIDERRPLLEVSAQETISPVNALKMKPTDSATDSGEGGIMSLIDQQAPRRIYQNKRKIMRIKKQKDFER